MNTYPADRLRSPSAQVKNSLFNSSQELNNEFKAGPGPSPVSKHIFTSSSSSSTSIPVIKNTYTTAPVIYEVFLACYLI